LNCVYNPANNEYVRTNTLVKNTIVQIDSTPFRSWYETHYGIVLGRKKKDEGKEKKAVDEKTVAIQKKRAETTTLASNLADQFTAGRIYACISSRPGQSGRADGYVLEGPELDFYIKKMAKKKSGGEKKA